MFFVFLSGFWRDIDVNSSLPKYCSNEADFSASASLSGFLFQFLGKWDPIKLLFHWFHCESICRSRNSGVQQFGFSNLAASQLLWMIWNTPVDDGCFPREISANVGICWINLSIGELQIFHGDQVLNEVAFKVLRTELQLGYVARGTQRCSGLISSDHWR